MKNDYLQFKAADFFSQILPRRFAYWIALRVADRYYCLDSRGRRAVMSNLRRIMLYKGISPSEQMLSGMARKTFQNFGKYLVDFFKYNRVNRWLVLRLVSTQNMKFLDQALELGKGALVVSAHLGSTEIGGAVLAALGYKLNGVVLSEPDRKIDKLFQRRRARRGVKVIPLGRAARGVLEALRRNEVVILLADRDYNGKSREVSFFGARARLPTGPAVLSVKTGAPIVTAFMLREPDDTYLLKFHPPLAPEPGMTPAQLQSKICALMEEEIAKYPSEWFMFDDFWGNKDSIAHGLARGR